MLKIRQVTLVGGHFDGAKSFASHATCIISRHVYVWDGGPDEDRFVEAKSLMYQMPEEDRAREQAMVRNLFRNTKALHHGQSPLNPLKDIPEWRVNMWLELFRYGVVE